MFEIDWTFNEKSRSNGDWILRRPLAANEVISGGSLHRIQYLSESQKRFRLMLSLMVAVGSDAIKYFLGETRLRFALLG